MSSLCLKTAHCFFLSFCHSRFNVSSFQTLFEKKFLLASSLAACCLKFNGSAVPLVFLMETSTIWNQVALSTLSTQTHGWFWVPEAYQPGLSSFRTVPWEARDRGGRGPELPGWADGWRMRSGCAAHGRQPGVRPEPGRHCQPQSRPAALQPALQVSLCWTAWTK